MKPKRCKSCRQLFTPSRPMQSVCSPLCAHQLAIDTREKMRRKETKAALEKFKTLHDYRKTARRYFNKWVVVVKGAGQPCISCGSFDREEFHAGHFINSTCKETEFIEDNVWKQCSLCNTHLRGNLLKYRANLVPLIGLERVEWLESEHPPRKFDKAYYEAISNDYRAKLKEAQA